MWFWLGCGICVLFWLVVVFGLVCDYRFGVVCVGWVFVVGGW